MPPNRLRRAAVAVASTAAVICAALVSAPTPAVAGSTSTAPPPPWQDPFYSTVPGVGNLPNGTVVRARRLDATVAFAVVFPVPTTSWQLAYKSLDARGRPIVNVTTLLVPTRAWNGGGRRPLVAYQNAEDSTGWQCAASYSLRANTNLITDAEQSVMATALDRGFALALADHEGPDSAFLAGPQSAHLVLDGIRAVQAFGHGGITRANPVGLWGYSGGGHATAWAAEQAHAYAPELRIAGAAFGGAPPSLADAVRKLDGGAWTAFVLMGVAGLDHAYPQWDIRSYLNAAGQATLATADDVCVVDVGVSLAFRRTADLTTVPDVLTEPSVQAVLTRIDLGQAAPSMPVHVYYSPLDEAIPVADIDTLLAGYCAGGTRVDADEQWLSDHVTLAVTGSGGALDFLADRFAGRPAPTDC